MALQHQLASNVTTAQVGGLPHKVFCAAAAAGGESGLVGGYLSTNFCAPVWRTKSLQADLRSGRRSGTQCPTGSSVTALPVQQTSSKSSSPAEQISHLSSCEENPPSDKVFEDEAQGICCYRLQSGEVTCEGDDEGPYFQPAECSNDGTAEAKSGKCESSSMEEVFSYKYIKGGPGKAWCEGKDEC